MQNLTVQAVNQTAYINQHKQARQSRKDQPWRRLATVNKIAQVKGWNLPTYREKRTITELLEQLGEYSYLTGKRLGTYYLSTLDLDIWKEEFHSKLVNRLVKNMACLLKFLQVSYDKTKKGLHVDILTPEPLSNGTIYWTDKLSKKWIVGSIQSKGKYVVGKDKNKTPIENHKWYWKAQSSEEVKITLNKFFFKFKEAEQLTKPSPVIQESKTPLLPAIFNSNIQKSKYTIQAKILSKQKIPLPHLWKVFYLDCQSKHTGYFLWNDYQRDKANLNLGTVQNIQLIQGKRHRFYSSIL